MHVRWSQLCRLREHRVPGTGSPYQRIGDPPPLPLLPPTVLADVEGERLPMSERTTLYVKSKRNRLKSNTSLMVNISCNHLPALVVMGWPLQSSGKISKDYISWILIMNKTDVKGEMQRENITNKLDRWSLIEWLAKYTWNSLIDVGYEAIQLLGKGGMTEMSLGFYWI